ncbi:hypothetical protein D3C80_2026810 [compost metagenome]
MEDLISWATQQLFQYLSVSQTAGHPLYPGILDLFVKGKVRCQDAIIRSGVAKQMLDERAAHEPTRASD